MHIQQAKTSKYCGQACLAMLAHCSLDEAIRAVGHRHGTSQNAILRAARRLGLVSQAKLWLLGTEVTELPRNCLVLMRAQNRKRGHWCCVVDGQFHDPAVEYAGDFGRNTEVVCLMEFATSALDVPASGR